jgi:hypothetical protein
MSGSQLNEVPWAECEFFMINKQRNGTVLAVDADSVIDRDEQWSPCTADVITTRLLGNSYRPSDFMHGTIDEMRSRASREVGIDDLHAVSLVGKLPSTLVQSPVPTQTPTQTVD